MSDYIYPFDPTGKAVSNLIQNERQTISPPNWTDFYFVIPKMAPYFRDSLRVVHRPSGKILVEGQDYHCTHFFHDASFGTANRIYGSITLLDKTLTGLLELEYQTLGGEWVIDEDRITSILSNTLANPRITTWEEVVEMPYAFPPIDHEWDLENLRNMDAVVVEIDKIADILRDNSDSAMREHIADLSNPHKVNKAQVGLDRVQNYPIANFNDSIEGLSNAAYLTPLRLKQVLDVTVFTEINEHVSEYDNPHQVTKTQIGLGNVNNYGIARTEDAQLGISDTLYMTPKKTTDLVLAYAEQGIKPHFDNVSNPHNVTKVQVGLGNVENYTIASATDAEEGISNQVYMTPLRTGQMVNLLVKGTLDLHVNDNGNPHKVTKAQVGLSEVQNYPIATNEVAVLGESNAHYMTPLRVKELLDQVVLDLGSSTDVVGDLLAQHIANVSNPHAVTASQVGTYDGPTIDTLLLGKLDVNAQAADAAGVEGKTVADILLMVSEDFAIINGGTF